MKHLCKSSMLAILAVGLSSSVAMSLSLPANTTWSSADYWTSTQLDSDFVLMFRVNELAGFSGIYFVDDINAPTNPFRLNLFNNDSINDDPTAQVEWSFNGINYDVTYDDYTGAVQTKQNVGKVFGFFQNYQGTTPNSAWYSDVRLNTDGKEHIFIATTNSGDNAWVYATEDFDQGQLVSTTYAIDIAPVPEPTTMLLFGTGLIGLAALSRRRKQK